jgi:Ca-activated chloride channel family protein
MASARTQALFFYFSPTTHPAFVLGSCSAVTVDLSGPETPGRKENTMRSARLAVVLILLLSPALIHAEDQPPVDKVLSPYFFIENAKSGVEQFPLKSTNVVASISGVVADVTVTQTYENQGTTPINARYVFPGSTRAAVHGMRIRIGDKVVVARIKERQQAAKEFEEAKAAGKSASLLEQQRPNVFSMAVANILPGDRVEVELTYSEMLSPEQGIYQFVYPAVVGPRYSHTPEGAAKEDSKFVASPYLHEGQRTPSNLSIKVNLSTGVPIAELRSPSHKPRIEMENPSLAHISLNNDKGARDFVLDYQLSGKEIQSGLILYEGAKENFFLLTVQPPVRVAQDEIPPREYIFVVDVSGSMHGFPLNTAKEVLQNLIGGLKPTDTFNVVLFSGGSRVLAPASLAANQNNIQQALSVIGREAGGGGTELAAALRTAILLPRTEHVSRSIVVVTDGFIAEEPEALSLIHQNLKSTNFFAFGIGSSVNRYLIEGIARAGQGEPFVVMNASEADAAGERFRQYIQAPLLTDIRVIYRGFDAYDVEPEAQPDLFAERPLVLFGKWRGPKTGQIEVAGRGATTPYSQTFDVKDSVSRPEHAALPQLWARTRIARLSDFNFQREDNEAVREVTTLGLTYSLLTRHTSFIAVLEQVRNPNGVANDVNQPLPLPEGVSDLAVGDAFGMGAEPNFWLMILGGGMLLLIVASLRARRRTLSC